MSKTTKYCTQCKTIKNISEFHKNRSREDGASDECANCVGERHKAYYHTKSGLISRIYGNQRSSSRARGHELPTYSKEELKEWMYSQKKFHVMFDNWKTLNFQKSYVPSVDRKNDFIGYTMDNIQLLTWKQNRDKSDNDRIAGIDIRKAKQVLKYNLEGLFICEYYSIMEAERQTGIFNGGIIRCCKGKAKKAGGFIWKYADSKRSTSA